MKKKLGEKRDKSTENICQLKQKREKVGNNKINPLHKIPRKSKTTNYIPPSPQILHKIQNLFFFSFIVMCL